MEAPLNLLYTHAIRGDLDLLPRLYTFIRRVMAEAGIEPRASLLVDLGESCEESVWHCGITEGRSTLIVLDAMGYDAANVQGVLTPNSREKLAEQVFLALVDDAHPHTIKGVEFFTGLPPENHPYKFSICLTPVDFLDMQPQTLYLPTVDKGQVGLVTLSEGRLTHIVHTMPPNTLPDATISGTVDFVLGEARYYEKQRKG